MGAKTAVKLRARGTAYKCNMCGRKLMSMEALISHERTAHNIITRRNKSKEGTKPLKTTKKEVKEKPTKKDFSQPKITQKVKFSEPTSEPVESEDKTLPRKRTVEFKCPKCFSVYASYFPAHKHIQKFHCVNRYGVKVPPNAPTLIQPIRIELCNKCNKKVKSIQNHKCIADVKDKIDDQLIICSACDEWMLNMQAFDSHVLSAHRENMESMFFPMFSEFTKWKIDMEAQTGVNYIILDKYDAKRYYHCNFVKENNKKTNTTYFCPSMIVVQEFPKGVQVHFFKQHCKHDFFDYKLKDEYKKYSITSFLKRSEEYNNLEILPSDDNDLYLQFKKLMEGIIVDAAKINISTLKILLGKALDMTSIVSHYDEEVEENDVILNCSHMTEKQITEALENTNMPLGKRKNNLINDETLQNKKIKQDTDTIKDMSPKILNSFSLADNNAMANAKNVISDTDNKNSDDEVDKSKQSNKKSSEWDPYSSSFNDSYKDFVVKNFPVAEAKIKKKTRKRPLFLTKIKQFKPNVTPKLPKSQEESNDEVKEKTQVRTSFDKPNIDMRYEVKEQEEGCNILILKV